MGLTPFKMSPEVFPDFPNIAVTSIRVFLSLSLSLSLFLSALI